MNAIDWLNSLTNFERKPPAKYGKRTFSAARYETLLNRLGDPHRSASKASRTVQILGTDGKGSTLAFLESLLRLGEASTCSFISPHLIRVEERFRKDGSSISSEELGVCLDRVRDGIGDEEPPTYFEALNAAFWLWVEREAPDFTLLETGLGGRLDTTTLSDPELKIITHLERDHVGLLGKKMSQIAGEKLAALRPGIPTLLGPQSPHLERAISRDVEDANLRVKWVSSEVETRILSRSSEGWRVSVEGPGIPKGEFDLGLLGDHQVGNFATALLAARELGSAAPGKKSVEVRPDWPGRCQVLKGENGARAVLDGSHTAMGGRALRAFLDAIPEFSGPREFVFSCSRDRTPWCYLRGLVRPTDRLVLADWDHPRIWRASDLRESLEALGWKDFSTNPELEREPAKKVLGSNPPPGTTRVYCGSLYWAGYVLDRSQTG